MAVKVVSTLLCLQLVAVSTMTVSGSRYYHVEPQQQWRIDRVNNLLTKYYEGMNCDNVLALQYYLLITIKP